MTEETERRTERRRALLVAARAVLERDGPAGLTMRALASEADVAPGLAYGYFGGRDALLEAVAADELAEVGRAMRRARAAAATPDEALAAMARAFLDEAARRFDRLAPLFARRRAGEEAAARLVRGRLIHDLMLVSEVLAEIAGLSPRDPAVQAESLALAGAAIGLLTMSRAGHFGPLEVDPGTVLDHYLGALLARLRESRDGARDSARNPG